MPTLCSIVFTARSSCIISQFIHTCIHSHNVFLGASDCILRDLSMTFLHVAGQCIMSYICQMDDVIAKRPQYQQATSTQWSMMINSICRHGEPIVPIAQRSTLHALCAVHMAHRVSRHCTCTTDLHQPSFLQSPPASTERSHNTRKI